MDFGKEAIEKIEQMTLRGMTVEGNGRMYSAANLHPVMYVPRQETLTVHNLRGFCGFINNDIDGNIAGQKMLIVVNSPEEVELISENTGDDLKRTVPVKAEVSDLLKTFPFGKFITQEEFAIAFRSLFVKKDGDDFDYVLSYSQKLVGMTAIEGGDDGVAQSVQIKKGVSGALKENVSLKAIVKLSPYRTFREVEQPESEFLLRVKQGRENEPPMIALFEADGGAWVNNATQNIVDYIQRIVEDIPIIA